MNGLDHRRHSFPPLLRIGRLWLRLQDQASFLATAFKVLPKRNILGKQGTLDLVLESGEVGDVFVIGVPVVNQVVLTFGLGVDLQRLGERQVGLAVDPAAVRVVVVYYVVLVFQVQDVLQVFQAVGVR